MWWAFEGFVATRSLTASRKGGEGGGGVERLRRERHMGEGSGFGVDQLPGGARTVETSLCEGRLAFSHYIVRGVAFGWHPLDGITAATTGTRTHVDGVALGAVCRVVCCLCLSSVCHSLSVQREPLALGRVQRHDDGF